MTETMANARIFLITAIICCFLSVITTIGIHSSFFELGDLSKEQRLLLYENPLYLLNRIWVIIHCLFVLISMGGYCLIQFKKSPGFIGLGFVFFTVFSFTEIFRQMFVLFYMNNLRRGYFEADDHIKEIILTNIDHASLMGYAMFGLFIVAFSLGNIFYGIGTLSKNKVDRILAFLLIIWGVGNLTVFGNEFWQIDTLNHILEPFNLVYQPVMRGLIGLWILKKYKELYK